MLSISSWALGLMDGKLTPCSLASLGSASSGASPGPLGLGRWPCSTCSSLDPEREEGRQAPKLHMCTLHSAQPPLAPLPRPFALI